MDACNELRLTPEAPPSGGSLTWLARRLGEMHLYGDGDGEAPAFQLAPEPPPLPDAVASRLTELGEDLDAFQTSLLELYWAAQKEPHYAFVREYLDRGKPENIVTHGRLNRLKRQLPAIIRPDVFVTPEGLKITEVDAVPGGFGILAALQGAYADLGFPPLGGATGIVDAFMGAMAWAAGKEDPSLAIAVSDESQDYRPEMEVLARLIREAGGRAQALHPRDVRFDDDGLAQPDGARIDVLYRFFELFDIKNVPKSEIFLYASKKKSVVVSPPAKAYLEEKLAAAFLFHEALAPFWHRSLGSDRFKRLKAVFPETWVVDGREAPPQSVIHGLTLGGRAVRSFSALKGLTQTQRHEWVLKPSGFSDIGWGSRGVRLGVDLPGAAWDAAVDEALEAWERDESPWILQRYHKPVVVESRILHGDRVETMEARGRYCPYYFRTNDGLQIGGVLVTLCPKDKKFVHGMTDAIMAPAGRRT